MKEEIDNLLKNKIYIVLPIDSVPHTKTILDAVCSHRRKQNLTVLCIGIDQGSVKMVNNK